MVEKIEDLSLPEAVVQRILKAAVPEGVNVGKEARSVLGRAAAVFVIYLTASATNTASSNNRKSIVGQDILDALEEMEFEDFLEPLQEFQEAFRKSELEKRNKKKESAAARPSTSAAPTVPADKENEVEEIIGE
ncbi:DNA polymerase epsilon subunit 3 [Sergentomyia squamirostris]